MQIFYFHMSCFNCMSFNYFDQHSFVDANHHTTASFVMLNTSLKRWLAAFVIRITAESENLHLVHIVSLNYLHRRLCLIYVLCDPGPGLEILNFCSAYTTVFVFYYNNPKIGDIMQSLMLHIYYLYPKMFKLWSYS